MLRMLALLCIVAHSPSWGQSTRDPYLPLRVSSSYAQYMGYVTYPENFSPTDEDPLENHIVGYHFFIRLEFQVGDTSFLSDPSMRIVLRSPGGETRELVADGSTMWSKCESCLGLDIEVVVSSPGWWGCYCFPRGYEFTTLSLEQVNRAVVQQQVFLRIPSWW